MFHEKKYWIFLFFPIFIGLLFLPNDCFTNDSYNYLDLAKNLARGRGFVHSYLYIDIEGNVRRMPSLGFFPLFSSIVSVFIILGLGSILSSKLVNVIFSVLILILLYFLTKKLFNKNISYITCLATAFFYPFVWNQVHAMSETVYIFFLVFTLYCLTKKENKWFLLAGALTGLSYLTRGTGILLLFSILIFILISKEKRLFEKIKLLCHVIFSFSAIALLWWIRNYLVMGNPFYYSQATAFSFNFAHIMSQFTVFEQVFLDILPLSIFIPVTFYTLRSDKKTLTILLTYPVLHILLFLVWGMFDTRLLSPVYLPLLILGIKGLSDFSSFLDKRPILKLGIVVSFFIFFLFLNFFNIFNLYLNTRNLNPLISEIIDSEGVAFLKENTEKDDVIMAPATSFPVMFYTDRIVIDRPRYAYYSEVENLPIKFYAIRFEHPGFGSDEFITSLRKMNVKYMFIFKNKETEKSIRNLYNKNDANYLLNLMKNNRKEIPSYLELIYNSNNNVIYKLNFQNKTY